MPIQFEIQAAYYFRQIEKITGKMGQAYNMTSVFAGKMPAAVFILQLVRLVIRSLVDPVNAEPMDK
jgi:hypothetical protein